MNFVKNRMFGLFVVLFYVVFVSINLNAQASTGSSSSVSVGSVFPYWNYDPLNDPRVQDLKQYFDGFFTAEWKIVSFEEIQQLNKTLEQVANNFNNLQIDKKAIAVCVRTELYTLNETNYNNQRFAIIILTGFLKDKFIPMKMRGQTKKIMPIEFSFSD